MGEIIMKKQQKKTEYACDGERKKEKRNKRIKRKEKFLGL